MLYMWLTVLLLLNAVWLLLGLLALPGNWLMVVTTLLFAWWRNEDAVFSPYTLVAITILALIAEVIEMLAGAGTARKRGATLLGSMAAVVGAITGGILGTLLIPLPVIGTFLGACLGAGLGVAGVERIGGRDAQTALSLGRGAAAGQFIGMVCKILTGILIWFVIAVAAFWR